MTTEMLLVGLGNPGAEYNGSRHNVGFFVTEAIAAAFASPPSKRMGGVVDVTSFHFQGKKVLLAKPQTFMNLSGRAVRFLVDFFKIPLDRVCVFHDDIDLPFGRVKIKKGGGNGGHNGLKNIDALVGTDYWRVRIGVGRPSEKSMVVSYVLGKFSGNENCRLIDINRIICDNLQTLLSSDAKQLETLINV